MTRREVTEIIAKNPNKPLYISVSGKMVGDIPIAMHVETSKSKLLQNAKLLTRAVYGTYLEQRPDLAGRRILHGDQQIVTFHAEEEEA